LKLVHFNLIECIFYLLSVWAPYARWTIISQKKHSNQSQSGVYKAKMRTFRSIAVNAAMLLALSGHTCALPGNMNEILNIFNGIKQASQTTDCTTSTAAGLKDKTTTAVTLTLNVSEKVTTQEETTTVTQYETKTHETTIVDVSTQVRVTTQVEVSTKEKTEVKTVPTTVPTTVEMTVTAEPSPDETTTPCDETEAAATTTTPPPAAATDECPCEESSANNEPTSPPTTEASSPTSDCDSSEMGGSPQTTNGPSAIQPLPAPTPAAAPQDMSAPPPSVTSLATISVFNICNHTISGSPCQDTPNTYLGGVVSADAGVTIMGVQCIIYTVPYTTTYVSTGGSGTVLTATQTTVSPMTECLATPIPVTEGISTFVRPGTQHLECDLGTSLVPGGGSPGTLKTDVVAAQTSGGASPSDAVPTSGAICRVYSGSGTDAPTTVTVLPTEVRWDILIVTSGASLLGDGSNAGATTVPSSTGKYPENLCGTILTGNS
jgi:hypothetical protein